MTDRRFVLVVSDHCHLCERARRLLERLEIPYREIDLRGDEAGELARRGVPVVFFPVLVDDGRVIAYGDISESELRRALPLGTA